VGDERVFIDCGMFQEREFVHRNWDACPVPPESATAVLLTHAHIDHCGLLPRLVKEGFDGLIYCTRSTAALADIMLRDSAHIQEEDAANKRRRHKREGREPKHAQQALFDEVDVINTLPLLTGVRYKQEVQVSKSIRAVFHEAGHILGSAMIEVIAEENGKQRRVLFSGDVGQWNKPLIQDPTLFENADYIIMESTYGNREHIDGGDIGEQFAKIVGDTMARGGNVVIPTFAVERAQEIMFHLSGLVHSGAVPRLRAYLDSPMAINVTGVFLRYRDSLDDEYWNMLKDGRSPLSFPGLVMTKTPSESKMINKDDAPCVIMSTSGMCTSGRIKHHLRHNIQRSASTILFVGYQAHGTLGRQILEKNPRVRIHGRDYPVRAQIAQIYGFSGHADRSDLLRWVGHIKSPPQRVFLTHGDEDAAAALSAEIKDRFQWPVHTPEYQEVVEL